MDLPTCVSLISPRFKSYRPTPTHFVQYLVETANKFGPLRLNPHWKPIWASCPHCLFDFDVVGKVETFDEDTQYIIEALGFQVSISLIPVEYVNFIVMDLWL